MNELAARLRPGIGASELQKLLFESNDLDYLHTKPNSQSLAVYSALLDSKAVPTFSHNVEISRQIAKFVSTPTGLGCIVSYLVSCPTAESESLVRVVELVLEGSQIVGDLLKQCEGAGVKLLFGSRILNVVASKTNIDSWLGSAERYSNWLSSQLVKENLNCHKLVDQTLKLGAPVAAIKPMLAHYEFIVCVFSKMRLSQRRFALLHGLVPHLPKSPGRAAKLLYDLKIDVKLMASVFHQVADLSFLRTTVVLAKHNGELLELSSLLLNEWCNKVYVETAAVFDQQVLTQFLVACAASLSAKDARTLSLSGELTSGVQNHLSSNVQSIRNMGTLLAEILAKQSGAKLEFGIHYTDYDWWIGIDEFDSTYRYQEDSKEFEVPAREVPQLKNILDPDSDDEEEEVVDFGDEADSDEETAPLYYLKDLVEYLRSDKYGEVFEALSNGADLILRKSTFGTEVNQYAEDVLRSACSLTDKFSIKNFFEMRQSLLNAVLVADPSKASKVVHLFSTGDWSLAQRQSLLISLAQSAHSLASGDQKLEVSHQLPAGIHERFTTLPRAKPIESSKDEFQGTVTRRSKRLEGNNEAKQNKFSKVSSSFFYPLFAARPPLRPVSYDSVVFAQWLRTLGVIVAEAYPGNEIPGMVSELWPLLKGLLSTNNEIIILEAVFTDLLILVDTAAAIIKQRFMSEIGIVFDLITAKLETASTPQMIELGRAAAGQLANIMQSIA